MLTRLPRLHTVDLSAVAEALPPGRLSALMVELSALPALRSLKLSTWCLATTTQQAALDHDNNNNNSGQQPPPPSASRAAQISYDLVLPGEIASFTQLQELCICACAEVSPPPARRMELAPAIMRLQGLTHLELFGGFLPHVHHVSVCVWCFCEECEEGFHTVIRHNQQPSRVSIPEPNTLHSRSPLGFPPFSATHPSTSTATGDEESAATVHQHAACGCWRWRWCCAVGGSGNSSNSGCRTSRGIVSGGLVAAGTGCCGRSHSSSACSTGHAGACAAAASVWGRHGGHQGRSADQHTDGVHGNAHQQHASRLRACSISSRSS